MKFTLSSGARTSFETKEKTKAFLLGLLSQPLQKKTDWGEVGAALASGADANIQEPVHGRSLLMRAAAEDNASAIRMLESYFVEHSLCDRKGQNAAFYAGRFGGAAAFEALDEIGTSLFSCNADNETVLMIVAERIAREKDPEKAQVLFESLEALIKYAWLHKIDLPVLMQTVDSSGKTALLRSIHVTAASAAVVDGLTRKGADPNFFPEGSDAPLDVAVEQGNAWVVEALVQPKRRILSTEEKRQKDEGRAFFETDWRADPNLPGKNLEVPLLRCLKAKGLGKRAVFETLCALWREAALSRPLSGRKERIISPSFCGKGGSRLSSAISNGVFSRVRWSPIGLKKGSARCG